MLKWGWICYLSFLLSAVFAIEYPDEARIYLHGGALVGGFGLAVHGAAALFTREAFSWVAKPDPLLRRRAGFGNMVLGAVLSAAGLADLLISGK